MKIEGVRYFFRDMMGISRHSSRQSAAAPPQIIWVSDNKRHGTEPNEWNAATTPLRSLSAHMSRVGGKWDASAGQTKLQMTLFCSVAETRSPVATKIIPLTTTWATFSLNLRLPPTIKSHKRIRGKFYLVAQTPAN